MGTIMCQKATINKIQFGPDSTRGPAIIPTDS